MHHPGRVGFGDSIPHRKESTGAGAISPGQGRENMNHTPMPWYMDGPEGIEPLVKGSAIRAVVERVAEHPRLETIAILPLGGDDFGYFAAPSDERMANAEFIVRACNSHTALLAAAKAVQDALHQFHPQHDRIPVGKGICEWGPCKQLREAIAAAEGRTT